MMMRGGVMGFLWLIMLLKWLGTWISSGEHDDNVDEWDVLLYLHSIVRRHDRVVGVYQRALATSNGDCRLQMAALRAWS